MRFLLMLPILALTLTAALPRPVAAHHVCQEHDALTQALASKYGERRVSSNKVAGKDRRLEFWVSQKGSWSLVLVLPNGRSCLKSSGPQPNSQKLLRS